MDILWLFSFLMLGIVTGFCAGLFGIGGGGIMVPILTFIFTQLAFPADHVVHMALATSMATIVPTALSSVLTHHLHRAVLWGLVAKITPSILLGTFAGTFLASYLSAKPLAIFFSCFMAFVALKMLLNAQVKSANQIPETLILSSLGSGIGAISALVAIGGGTLTVPLLLRCNVALPAAIGTSAAVGLPIAFSGAVGYAVNGWNTVGLPAHTTGFIYWPAVLAIAITSFFMAPIGAKLAHKLPVRLLKKLFALLLIGLAVQMLYTVFNNS